MNTPEILTASDSKLVLSLDKGLYPVDVIYGAAYVFIDKAYLLLGQDEDKITVEFAPKGDASEDALRAIAGDFGNELLSQALRRRIAHDNQPLLEAIVSQALAGATGMVAIGDFLDEDEDDLDFLDDPLGIAVPWEEKFGGESDDAAAGEAGEAADATDEEGKA